MVPHTATGEWQSFEIRMRRRRAERLAVRAQAAAEAGHTDDARALIEEARALEPGLPALAQVEHLLNEEIPRARRNRSLRRALAIVATLAVAATAGYAWGSRPAPRLSSHPIAAQVSLPAAPMNVAFSAQSTAGLAEATPPIEPLPTDPIEPTVSELLKASREVTLPPSTDLAINRTEAAPPQIQAPALPVAAGADGVAVAAAVRLEPVVPAPAAVEPPPAPAAAAAPPVDPPQEPLVRSVLGRYASAYNNLDADAAQRVWPGVNYPALSRAFDALSTQQVSLGDCRVDVAGNRAQARCAGSTTWTAKVGSRSHTEARTWMFDLAREGTDWQIVSARVQNR